MASDDVRESRKLVRMYSWDVEERLPPGSDAYILGQVLGQEASRDDLQSLMTPWRKFFEPDEPTDKEKNPITGIIAVESVKLREKWVAFQKNSPKEERLNLQKFEPTIESVIDMVTYTTNAWHARRERGWPRKVASLFLKFGRTLHSHKTLLELLPQGNEYVSIFTGTLSAVIQACANHEKIAEGLSEALCAISEHVVECKVEQSLFQTPAMLERIADLYAHIFLFLTSTMDWLMEKRYKRMLDSFNENFSKRFDDEVSVIKHKAELIRNLAAQSSRVELRATRLTVEDMRRDVRIGLEADARHQAEMRYLMQRIEKEMAGAKKERGQINEGWQQLAIIAKQMLQEGAMAWLSTNRAVSPLQLLDGPETPFYGTQNPRVVSQWTAKDISVNSRGLEDFFSRGRVRLSGDPFSPVMVNPKTLARLSEWSEGSSSSQVLWLEGPHIEADDFENPVTMMAAKFVDLADRSRVPVMSYFCQLSRHERLRPGNTREAQAMTALVYALLRQMVELLLPRLETDVDMSETRFQRLDGTAGTWEDALLVFSDLLALMPDAVLCVLDGFQWLDDRSTNKYLKGLLQVLRGDKLKVLFTTTGRSACLRQAISSSETLVVETLQPRSLAEGLDRQEFWKA